ncbi:hypothetical protein CERZMDRAFT_100231 [Cercospora zeae-maydis SCOH1-5]|uniref:Uncharacterized protein n=1 Tax=Cercospora zeae-maydis SCOH1-5 TaxID=717836 RepID=A0A6A6F8M5_9PEZI|nr:hypothetical protein CERZMDRAFT_100231 [Cercospora zeae-maydis SCOH1-5]
MAMNFAPYQSSPPESDRAKSPPPVRSPPSSPGPQSRPPRTTIASVADHEDPWAAARAQKLPSPSQYQDLSDSDNEEESQDISRASRNPYYNDYIGSRALEGGGNTALGGRGGLTSIYETSLGLNIALESTLAYLLLPPAGGVVLLLFEHKSDYVRFHAWQSALVFSALFLVHIIFSWTAVISWLLFILDIVLIGYLAYGAWRYAETLDRVEVPIFGRLASSFVDDE